jgi:quercetin dioxygenase-like cupin family protein
MQQATGNMPGIDGHGTRAFDFVTGTRLAAPTGGPILSIDLAAAFRLMQHESRWSGNRNAMTLVKHRDLRLVLSALRTGTRLAQHNVRGSVLIQVLKGRVRIRVLDAALVVAGGEVVSMDANLEHEVQAIEDAVLLIAIAWPGESGLAHAAPALSEPEWDWRADETVWN